MTVQILGHLCLGALYLYYEIQLWLVAVSLANDTITSEQSIVVKIFNTKFVFMLS